MNSFRNKRGIVMVYVLLIVFIITAIALTISVVIINELRLTSTAADATLAYYAAESGIERGLHTIQRLRSSGTETLGTALAAVQGLNDALSNNTTYDNSESDQVSAIIRNQFIGQDRYVQADYYNFDDSLTAPANIAQSLVVSNSGSDPASWAEVSWIAWDASGVLGQDEAARKIIGPTDLANAWTIRQLDIFGGAITPVGYRIRIKALFGDISSLSAIPYDGIGGEEGNDEVDLPSQIQIKSIGERSGFQQALTATVPWKLPLGGLYDYVLYGEEEILKDIILSSPTYSSGSIEIESDIADADLPCSGFSGASGECDTVGWEALSVESPTNAAYCEVLGVDDGVCNIRPDTDQLGFALPIPATVPASDEYYVTLRMRYDCTDGQCDGRDIAVEIDGQSIVVDDQAVSNDGTWHTCTISQPFNVGIATLPITDPSRIIKITNHPYGYAASAGEPEWDAGDLIHLDWYQLSTFKLFQDCE